MENYVVFSFLKKPNALLISNFCKKLLHFGIVSKIILVLKNTSCQVWRLTPVTQEAEAGCSRVRG
jgi:hypothetical protein